MKTKEDIFFIYEGLTEDKFLNHLINIYENKFNVILVKANGVDKIKDKYKKKKKTFNYSRYALMYDLDGNKTVEDIKKQYKGLDLSNTTFYFVNPNFELVLLIGKTNNPDIYSINKEIENYYGVKEYRKQEKQVNKILKQIKEEEINNIFRRLKSISRNDKDIKSSNYYDLFNKIVVFDERK